MVLLWDDTLFMTVLFLANMGRIRGNKEYIEEAQYQFLLHVKYLTDKKTGMWFTAGLLMVITTLQRHCGEEETVGLQWQFRNS